MANEWIEWRGGECPVSPDELVDIRWLAFDYGKGGVNEETCLAKNCQWTLCNDPEGKPRSGDIVAYRISERA